MSASPQIGVPPRAAGTKSVSHGQACGFTLVELLVVMAIIGTLIALLLPAVQAARSSARNTECRNHIKQLALAISNYEGANKKIPPAGLCGDRIEDAIEGPFNSRGGQMLSWVVLVLPFIEETNLYRQFNLGQSVLQQTGDPQAVPLVIMLCPSDETERRFFLDSALTQGKRFAKGNYAAFVSPYHTNFTDWWPSGLSGAHPYRMKDILDGASRTLILGEVRTRENEQDQRGAWALPWTGSTLLAFDMHDNSFPYPFDATLRQSYMSSTFPYTVSQLTAGEAQPPNNLGPNIDVIYNCLDPEGAQKEGMPCATFSPTGYGWLSAAPRSRHVGGANCAFVDGHIGFLPDTIDETTMAYLISSNDGHTVDMSQVR